VSEYHDAKQPSDIPAASTSTRIPEILSFVICVAVVCYRRAALLAREKKRK
jgi:hypothetical protein